MGDFAAWVEWCVVHAGWVMGDASWNRMDRIGLDWIKIPVRLGEERRGKQSVCLLIVKCQVDELMS